MASSVQILRYTQSPIPASQPKFSAKSSLFYSEFHSRKRILRLPNSSSSRYKATKRFRVCCGAQDSDKESNGEEPPESLFMKELKRRGMTPTSLLEETNRTDYGPNVETSKEERAFSQKNAVFTEVEKNLANQRERSMKLNSEGLEGLIPRAKLLLTIGGTFFLGFGPLILITIAFFSALYFSLSLQRNCRFDKSKKFYVRRYCSRYIMPDLKNNSVTYFGPSFVHDASQTRILPPQYIDPYALLEEERISQIAPRVN